MRKVPWTPREVMESLRSTDYETVYHRNLRKNKSGDSHRDAFMDCGECADCMI